MLALAAALLLSAEPAAVRGEVVIVPMADLAEAELAAVEKALAAEYQVTVRRAEKIAMPQIAWYEPRKRWRAEKILAVLTARFKDLPRTSKVIGLAADDISTSKGGFDDWGIFGLGDIDGRACVVSSFRLRRKAKDAAHVRKRIATTAVHEVGHTFGLEHCPEPLCVMLDAEGGIKNTDETTGHLGAGCRAKLEAHVPVR
jgi:archaemetzincin